MSGVTTSFPCRPGRLVLVLLAAACAPAWACGPSPQKLLEHVQVPVPAATAWRALRDPARWPEWYPGLRAIETGPAAPGEEESGQTWHLHFGDGSGRTERFRELDAAGMREDFRPLEGGPAVENLRLVMQVKDSGAGQAEVAWAARFNARRAEPGEDQAALDQAAADGLRQAFRAQLAALAARLSGTASASGQAPKSAGNTQP